MGIEKPRAGGMQSPHARSGRETGRRARKRPEWEPEATVYAIANKKAPEPGSRNPRSTRDTDRSAV